MSRPSDSPLLVEARRLLGAEVELLADGYCGETFAVSVAGERLVLRLYVRQPDRAAIDVALLSRLARLVPVPEVLEARTLADDPAHPPFVLTRHLPGERLARVLPQIDPETSAALGESVATALAVIGTQVSARPGGFRDAALDPDPELLPSDLAAWAENRLGARWAAADLGPLLELAEDRQPLVDELIGEARLVHGDFVPGNLLVDPVEGALVGVLDWERAHSGSPLADAGALLRPRVRAEFVRAFVETYEERALGLREGWLAAARTLDLFALIDLAGQADGAPAADAAEALLRRILADPASFFRRRWVPD